MRNFIFLLLVQSLALNAGIPAFAGTPSSSGSLSYDQICNGVMNEAQGSNGAKTTQRYSYCQAATQGNGAVSSNSSLWKVWSMVSGVCMTACMPFAGAALQTTCTTSNMGATATDAAVTKQFAGSLMGVGTTLATSKGKPKLSNGHTSACITAATAALQTFTKKATADQAGQGVQSNLAHAAQEVDPSSMLNASTGNQAAATAGGIITKTASQTQIAAIQPKSPACAKTDGASILQCAISTDPSLAPIATSGDLADTLKQNTGMTPSEFLSKVQDPQGGILAAGGGAVTGSPVNENLDQISNALADMKKTIDFDTPGSAYAGGGPPVGANPQAKDEDPPIADMVAAMMKGLAGGPDPAKKPDAAGIRFAGRAPAASRGNEFDDRNYSLFERITHRYTLIGKRLLDSD